MHQDWATNILRRRARPAVEAIERRRLFAAVVLNEIEPNDPGKTDNRYQFVELTGTPGMVLTNDYFVAFDGISGTTGVADLVVNLSPYSLGSNGMLVIKSSATAGHVIPSATTPVSNPTYFTAAGGFPNGSLSFYLFNSTTAFVAGTDYDTNDDGVLDHLPTGATAIDHVAVPNTKNSKDIVYGGVQVAENPTLNKGTADAVTRFPNNTAVASAAWFGGELVDTNNVASQLQYDFNRRADNEPANAYLTPGAANCTPTFGAASYAFSISKPAAVGTTVGTVWATPIGTDTATYGLTGSGASNFAVTTGGAVTLAANAPAATYNLSVTATDDQTGVASSVPVTITVLRGTSAVTLSSNTSSAPYGQTVSLTAVVTPASATGYVQFFDGAISLGNPVPVTSGVANLTTNTLSTGGHPISAAYGGDGTFNTSPSNTVNLSISPVAVSLAADSLYLELNADGQHVDVWYDVAPAGLPGRQLLLSSVASLSVQASTATFDFSAGPFDPAGGMTFSGPSLKVIGTDDGDDISAAAGSITVHDATISYVGTTHVTFQPGAGPDDLQLTGGDLTLAAAGSATGVTVMSFLSVAVSAGSRLTVADTPSQMLVVTTGLDDAGTLDLADNDLIVVNGDVASILHLIRTAYAGNGSSAWSGPGLTSSAAAADPRHLKSFGVVGNDHSGTPLFSDTRLFDGYDPGPTDVLVKSTFAGDANLDGRVDGSDYSLIDGRPVPATTWYAGDFNYDGVVDGSDYTLIDNAYNRQSSTAAAAATPSSIAQATVGSRADWDWHQDRRKKRDEVETAERTTDLGLI